MLGSFLMFLLFIMNTQDTVDARVQFVRDLGMENIDDCELTPENEAYLIKLNEVLKKKFYDELKGLK